MPTGLTKDAGWEIGVSRTVAAPPERVWRVLTSARGLGVWLGPGARLPKTKGSHYETSDGISGEVRSFRPLDRVRITWRPTGWQHDSTVQVAISKSRHGAKTTVRFHQERLRSAAEREQQRAYWRQALERLGPLFGSTTGE
jgi:uncharacterized protein YndB with AHSA1/START domain